ncbi:hypothetical protein M427DRAFT_32885 [Gonapodya prolifera JEL478]|uniref:Uncharacterized protein n=1 Tax=Gonapodya prolifera (strain JEL478) TaxID=1344416 RepID=A0A139AE08_GONPJ|nr:hypothetical protein M427DRAFT_32885 [Gonapodya prolifera JEL478]|eukprot:KXS14675.1 hypothetical protein M427DRAFT_32885 [Gonapodya prolifera JEL478]
MASKYCETPDETMSLSFAYTVSCKLYTKHDIKTLELRILDVLNWDLSSYLTPVEILSIVCEVEGLPFNVEFRARTYLCKAVRLYDTWIGIPPSLLALAALYKVLVESNEPIYAISPVYRFPLDGTEIQYDDAPFGKLKTSVKRVEGPGNVIHHEVASVDGVWTVSNDWSIEEENGEHFHHRRSVFKSGDEVLNVHQKFKKTA